MTNPKNKVVHAFEKNSAERVQVTLSTFKGREYMDLRVYFEGDDGEMHPSRKGLTLSTALLPDLESAILKLREAVGSRGVDARRVQERPTEGEIRPSKDLNGSGVGSP